MTASRSWKAPAGRVFESHTDSETTPPMSTKRTAFAPICCDFATRPPPRRASEAIALASAHRLLHVKHVHRAVDGRGVARRRDFCSTCALRCHS